MAIRLAQIGQCPVEGSRAGNDQERATKDWKGTCVEFGSRNEQWATWMRAGIAGDGEAYRRFLEAVTPFVRGTAVKRCSQLGISRAEVEDIVQNVLLAVHLKRGTWDPGRPLGP